MIITSAGSECTNAHRATDLSQQTHAGLEQVLPDDRLAVLCRNAKATHVLQCIGCLLQAPALCVQRIALALVLLVLHQRQQRMAALLCGSIDQRVRLYQAAANLKIQHSGQHLQGPTLCGYVISMHQPFQYACQQQALC